MSREILQVFENINEDGLFLSGSSLFHYSLSLHDFNSINLYVTN